jgi:hypothetical protein
MARWTVEQYETLKAAIAQGALRVEYADKRIEYKSDAEMRRLLSEMEIDLGLVTPVANGSRRVGNFSKGL